MAIDFSCTCGKVLRAPDEFAGKKAKCSACGLVVDVPGGERSTNGSARPTETPQTAPAPPREAPVAPAAAFAKPQAAPAKRSAAAEKATRTSAPTASVEADDDLGLAPEPTAAAPATTRQPTQAASATPAATTAAAPLADFFDAELSTGPAAVPTGNYCPSCRQAVPVNALVCINCGFDSRTGKKRETVVMTDQPKPVALEYGAPRKIRATRYRGSSSYDINDIFFSFDGRIPRRVFWPAILGLMIMYGVGVAAIVAVAVFMAESGLKELMPVLNIVFLGMAVLAAASSLAIQVKRWHDIGISGWCVLLNFVPGVNLLVFLALGLLPGSRGENTYGPDPRR